MYMYNNNIIIYMYCVLYTLLVGCNIMTCIMILFEALSVVLCNPGLACLSKVPSRVSSPNASLLVGIGFGVAACQIR